METEARFKDGRKMGNLVNGVVFIAFRSYRKHLYRGGLRTPGEAIRKRTASWTCDNAFLTELEKEGVKFFVVKDLDRGYYFWVSMKRLMSSGYLLDFGEGDQRHLQYDAWNQTGDITALIGASMMALRRVT